MKCTNCGEEITGRFCTNCGAPAPQPEQDFKPEQQNIQNENMYSAPESNPYNTSYNDNGVNGNGQQGNPTTPYTTGFGQQFTNGQSQYSGQQFTNQANNTIQSSNKKTAIIITCIVAGLVVILCIITAVVFFALASKEKVGKDIDKTLSDISDLIDDYDDTLDDEFSSIDDNNAIQDDVFYDKNSRFYYYDSEEYDGVAIADYETDYTLSSKKITITVPEEIDGKKVVEIDMISADYDDDAYVTIVIPGTVKVIRNFAMGFLDDVDEIIIKDGVEIIEQDAFTESDDIKKATVPASVKVMDNCGLGMEYDDDISIKPYRDFVMYGEKGSQAEKYAKENGLKFVEK